MSDHPTLFAERIQNIPRGTTEMRDFVIVLNDILNGFVFEDMGRLLRAINDRTSLLGCHSDPTVAAVRTRIHEQRRFREMLERRRGLPFSFERFRTVCDGVSRQS